MFSSFFFKKNQIYTLEPIFEESKNYICAAGFDIFLKKKEENNQTTITPVATKKTTHPKREPKVWMISASAKYFDHRKCFEKLGHIYWKQYNKLQVGDTGYIYFSKPQQKIVYKYEVIACDVPYTSDYDAEKEFYKREEDFESAKKHNRYYLIKKIGESTSGKLTLSNMMQHGLKQAPLGAMELSSDNCKSLLNYIEENF